MRRERPKHSSFTDIDLVVVFSLAREMVLSWSFHGDVHPPANPQQDDVMSTLCGTSTPSVTVGILLLLTAVSILLT